MMNVITIIMSTSTPIESGSLPLLQESETKKTEAQLKYEALRARLAETAPKNKRDDRSFNEIKQYLEGFNPGEQKFIADSMADGAEPLDALRDLEYNYEHREEAKAAEAKARQDLGLIQPLQPMQITRPNFSNNNSDKRAA